MTDISSLANTRVVLKSRPVGMPTDDNFDIQTVPVTPPGEDEMLLCTFFVVTEWLGKFEETAAALGQWIKEGKLKYRATIEEGIENALRAFRMLFTGDNFGKLMVKVADPE